MGQSRMRQIQPLNGPHPSCPAALCEPGALDAGEEAENGGCRGAADWNQALHTLPESPVDSRDLVALRGF